MLSGCLDELGLEAAHVVGHSQGAMFALWLALAAPERVRSVVTIGVPAVAFGSRIEALRVLARPGLGPLMLWMPMPPSAYRCILVGTMGEVAVRANPDLVRATYWATHRSGYATTVSSELRELFRGAAERRSPRSAANLRNHRSSQVVGREEASPPLTSWGEHPMQGRSPQLVSRFIHPIA